MKREFKKILVIRNDRFGEFLLNVPAIRALKETYPRARLTLAVNHSVAELAGAVEGFDEVVIWDDAFRKQIRSQRFDVGVVLNPTKEAHWALFRAGIPVRVGYDRKWGFLLNRKMQDNKKLGLKHEVEYNLDLVGLLIGGNKKIASSRQASLAVPRNDRYEFLQNAIAIHPFTSDPLKQWPPERFMELAKRILQEMNAKVVLIGKGLSPQGTVPSGIINMVNKTSLVELAALLERCSLLISGDSGPMHLAAAVGTPVIALFRSDLPGKTARRWGPWGEGHIVIESNNLLDITVDEVLSKVSNRIASPLRGSQ